MGNGTTANETRFTEVGDGITLCNDSFGDPSDPPVLMIMGLSTQMIAWDEEFCRGIAERGFHVIRFDNRDIGLSSEMGFPPPSLRQLLRRRFDPRQYRIGDMARDTVGLMDALGVESAHVVGASMGGMIAQTLAFDHPERVRSLTSIMSNTGSRRTGQPALPVYLHFMRRRSGNRDAQIEDMAKFFSLVGSRGELRDLDQVREKVARSYDRSFRPAGGARQLAAILSSGSRSHRLGEIRVPTTVIHGTADRLIRPSGGRATAAAIPGAELLIIDQMGHDLPRPLWPRLTDAITNTAERAEAG